MAGKELTTREVARLLSVSEATVKRWADKQLLAPEKTAGGHRRFRAESIARFLRDRSPGAVPRGNEAKVHFISPSFERRRAGGVTVSSLSMFDALVNGREDEATALLIKAYLHEHSLAHIFDEILAQVMRRIGELWHQGELTVAREHLATRTALAATHTLREVVIAREPNGLLAICCGIEGDFHELAVQFAQILLESEGWKTISLGANTPFFALAEAMLQHGPILACVSSTVSNNPDRAAREYLEVRRAAARVGVSIVLGGAGFEDQQLRRRFPADLYADNFRQLSEFAASLSARQMMNTARP